jgi:hypothetical protein
MDAPVRYMEELRSELGLYPTWLPGDPIELGAYGRIVRGQFVADGRLADLGIEMVAAHHEQAQPLKKHRGMTFRSGSQTSAMADWIDAELGIHVEVASKHAWAFAARGVTKVEIENIHEVRRAVLEAHKAGSWERRWYLVSELRRAAHVTVLVARSKEVTAKVKAKAKLRAADDVLLEETASFELSSDDVFSVPGVKNATPLYGLRKLRGFLDPALEAIRGGAGEEDEALDLALAPDEPMFG